MLSIAVPIWIERSKAHRSRSGHSEASPAAGIWPSTATTLLFRTEGKTALAFNKLAQGIACCAYQPGGMKVFGLHFDAEP